MIWYHFTCDWYRFYFHQIYTDFTANNKIKDGLTFKAPITIKADDNFDYFFLFSEENKSWYFMWIVCQIKNKNFRISSATNFAWHFKC